MTKYIELIGVPGVGKTTTYNFLGTKAAKNDKWILYEDLIKYKVTDIKNLKAVVKQYIGKITRLNAITPNMNTLDNYFQSNPQLMELFWERIAKKENNLGKDLRFYSVNYIMAVIEKIQNIKDAKLSRYCILDEGLVHNVNYFTNQNSTLKQISSVLDIMDLPKAVVYFDGELDIIIDRTLMRGKLRPRDENLSSKKELINSRLRSIQEKELYVEAIQSKDIPLLKLEARESVMAKSERIQSFIQSLPE